MKLIQLGTILAAIVLGALGLAACGDSDSGGSGDEDQITAAIEKAATSGDPAACTEVQTQKFTEQTNGGTGAEAVKTCEDDAADSASDSVEVSDIELDGDKATAKAAFGGGFIDGQTLDVALVKDGDAWKLDEATGFDEFDREAFIAGSSSTIEENAGDAPPEALACIKEQLNQASDEDLQALVLEADAGDQFFGPCFGGQ